MRCFGNPIIVSGFIICNILYCIVESVSLIRWCRHGWPNHVKTSCTVCVIFFIFVFLNNIVDIKACASTTELALCIGYLDFHSIFTFLCCFQLCGQVTNPTLPATNCSEDRKREIEKEKWPLLEKRRFPFMAKHKVSSFYSLSYVWSLLWSNIWQQH